MATAAFPQASEAVPDTATVEAPAESPAAPAPAPEIPASNGSTGGEEIPAPAAPSPVAPEPPRVEALPSEPPAAPAAAQVLPAAPAATESVEAPKPSARLLPPPPIPNDAQQAVAPLKKQALRCLMAQTTAASLLPDTASNPERLAAAQKLLDLKQPLAATLSLMRWRAASTPKSPLPAEFWPLQAQAFTAAGLVDWASAILADPAARWPAGQSGVPLRLGIAEWRYQHGQLGDAQQVLTQLKPRLRPTTEAQWQDLQARLDLTEQRSDEALKVLASGSQNDPAQTAFGNSGGVLQIPYLSYNLGVSLIRAGRVPEGRAVLDRVGHMPADSSELLALRDKANLALGWQFLEEKQGATATAIFERVRLDGPFSNRALLGIGWAELAEKGKQQAHPATGLEQVKRDQLPSNVVDSMLRAGAISCEEANHYYGYAQLPCGNTKFSRSQLPAQKDALLKRALVPWLTLAERDPLDAAVQESWLAIPYGLQQLGANTEAAEHYEEAMQRLESLRLVYSEAIAAAEEGRLLPPSQQALAAEHVGIDARFDASNTQLQRLLAEGLPEHPWHNALQDEQDLQWLALRLEERSPASPADAPPGCGTGLAEQLRNTAIARRTGLDHEAAKLLREKQALLDRYLLAARVAMNRSLDASGVAAAPASTAERTSSNPVLRALNVLLQWFHRKPTP